MNTINSSQIIITIENCKIKLGEIRNSIHNINTVENTKLLSSNAYNELLAINFDSYIEKLDVEIKEIKDFLDDYVLWKSFNNQYKEYYKSRLLSIKTQIDILDNYNLENIKSTNNYWQQELLSLLNNLNMAITRDSKFDLFEHFRFGEKNYILFGKNGAGKTTLLKELSSTLLNSNAVVIPATRNILYNGNAYHYQSEVSLSNALKNTDNGKSLFLLAKLILDEEIRQRRDLVQENKITTNVAIDIFDKLGTERTLLIDQHANLELFKDDSKNKYPLTDGSDGERSVVFILFAVLMSPRNSYVFIDEPENHLNGSLMRKLFDNLERYRADIKFIFATHNIQFIESRKNTELIYLEKASQKNQWLFKKIENHNDLSLDIVLNIEGTNDNVIFCEGEDRNSYDYKLYETLYPEYEIVPAQGCDNVIKQTVMLNKFSSTFKKIGLGIVDHDFRDVDNIESLKSKKVTVLTVNEVENLFILEPCLSAMKEFIHCSKSVNIIKNDIIAKILVKQDDIKKDYATKLLRRLHNKNKLEDIINISVQLDSINIANKTKFLEDYNDFQERLSSAIEQKEYEVLLKMVPAKMLLNDVAAIFDLKSGVAYKDKLLMHLNNNISLQQKIRETIKLIEE